jgi:biopolymer transport protein TolR
MSMNVGSKKGAMASINITPYIDILLVLLIIFMVITPIRQMDLDVKVPQADDTNTEKVVDPSVIVISVGDAAQIAINGEPQTIDRLGAKLQEIYSARANKNMFISASAKLPYGDVVKVIDIAKGAGVGDIGLITEEIQ